MKKIDINKVRNYNQKLLAAFGSLAVILIIVLIIISISTFISDIRWRNRDIEPEIVSNEVAEDNYENQIRTHQVSFETLRLIDTANVVYLLPVSQSALKLDEFIDKNSIPSNGSLGLLDMYGGYSNFYYDDKSYNNAIIFDSRDASVEKLFQKRLSINKIYIKQIETASYVFFAVTDKDSNKDGILNADDFKTLYYYSVRDKELTEVKSDNTDFVDFDIIPNKSQIIIKYGLDKDANGKYDWDEPMIMKVYSIKDKKLNSLVGTDLIDKLQATLDGKL